MAAPLLLLAACGSGPEPPKRAEAVLPIAHVDQATAGTISGRVLFNGDAPELPVIDMSSNPQCERQHHTPQKAETVVVNTNKTLRNVFIWIKDGLPRARWTPPVEPAKLDQNGCVYEPHVLGIMQGQQLEILNNDPVNHNVHAESQVNPAWNESQPPRAEHKFKRFDSAEVKPLELMFRAGRLRFIPRGIHLALGVDVVIDRIVVQNLQLLPLHDTEH